MNRTTRIVCLAAVIACGAAKPMAGQSSTNLSSVLPLLLQDVRGMGKQTAVMVIHQRVNMPKGDPLLLEPESREKAQAAGVGVVKRETTIKCVSSYTCELLNSDVLLELSVVSQTPTSAVVDVQTSTEIKLDGKPRLSHRTYRYRLELINGKWKIMSRDKTVVS